MSAPPVPPGVQVWDEDHPLPAQEEWSQHPDPLDNVTLDVSQYVLAAKLTAGFTTFAGWNIDVAKTCNMGGKTVPASVSNCFKYKGFTPALGSAFLFASTNVAAKRAAEKWRLGSLGSTGLMLTPLLAVPLMLPLEVIKRQYQFYQMQQNIRYTRKAIVAKHGIKGLYRGWKPFLAMQAAYISSFALPQLLPYERDTCNDIGGALFLLSWILVQPLDVLTNRQMLKQNAGRTLLEDARMLGRQGLVTGFPWRLLALIVFIGSESNVGYTLINLFKAWNKAKEEQAAQMSRLPPAVPVEKWDIVSEDIEDDELLVELLGKERIEGKKKEPYS